MTDTLYFVLSGVLTVGVLVGISLLSRVKTAVLGNTISVLCTAGAVVLTMYKYNLFSAVQLWICIAVGLVFGLVWSYRIKMIQMPQVVALLNGFGGAAAALVAIISLLDKYTPEFFSLVTAALALAVGMTTLTGSLIAAGKLHKVINQKPVIWPGHQAITTITLILVIVSIVMICLPSVPIYVSVLICFLLSGFFGIAFAIRVGGADMPITISLLVSFSGIADAIAGMAIGNILLVALGGTVGASGLLLTQIMCRAMNRHLSDILMGKTSVIKLNNKEAKSSTKNAAASEKPSKVQESDFGSVLQKAKRVIIIPGYGMAIAQAQQLVRQLADKLEKNGADVDFAIHPVAGRMPGHMNVLLAEADVPYEKLCGMDEINSEFDDCDVAIIIGANDVVNPAANTAEDTPIYGMPVLNADHAKHVIICNYDLSPGYAGVDNPLYKKSDVTLLLGDAKDTVQKMIDKVDGRNTTESEQSSQDGDLGTILQKAKRVIIIPGYGMAIAQAQQLVRQMADKLEKNGAEVDFAIHPVAGRMPGHMNVLLAEADVPYEKLRGMDEINSEFDDCDVAIIIGANDVVNPAANTAEDTPIYGMPVLNADHAKHVIVCNYDLSPGYAGVDNPLYKKSDVTLLLGDAKDTVQKIIDSADGTGATTSSKKSSQGGDFGSILQKAKRVIIIPGYGMAIAQAQQLVRQLADKLEKNGADVDFAIHPVAGRMPGHMNVLLAEADVPYEKLRGMDEINTEFDDCDVAIIIGANDVVNPAANTAEDTPIYGMPVLNADHAKHVIICNYDLSPGYAGVDNPLYQMSDSEVTLLLGDAKDTVQKMIDKI